MSGQRRSAWEKFSRQQNTTSETEYENDDLSHAQVAKIEEQIQLPGEHSRHSSSGETETGKGGSAKSNGKQEQEGQQSGKSNAEAVKNGPAQGQDTKKARPPDKKKELDRINSKPSENDDAKQKKDSTEKQLKEDMSTELQTLAQELSITGSSPREIFEAACRKSKELEELKKVVFLAKNVNDKEHDIKKIMAEIQDHHSCEKELTDIKIAVMNPEKRKDFKPTHSTKEVVERINTLHSSQEELTAIKTVVMNTTKSKDLKLTQSADEVVDRIQPLHGIEHECLGLKEIVFNKELLKLASLAKLDEKERTEENANKIAAELTRAADESRTEIQQQKTKLEEMEKEITELNKQLTDTRDKHQALLKRNQQLTDELKEVKSQKEKALTRLSEVAGGNLTKSNPYITDLSDPNRPEKIGEQLSELYDNLWTDVFEKLSGTCKLSERDSIQTLLRILEDSYGYCKNISSKRYSNTLAELTLWKLVEPLPVPKTKGKNTSDKKKHVNNKETTVNITLEDLQILQTLLDSPSYSSPPDSKAVDSILAKIGLNVTSLSTIKKMLKSSLEGTSVIVQESFWKQRSEDPNGQKEVLECTKPFLMKCVHICWLMVGQDPPVYLRFSDRCKEKFNKDVYREYTANGNVLDFVVWPAIFLHENGPLLKKGVAQPISKK